MTPPSHPTSSDDSRERWSLVRRLVEDALDRPEGERPRFLRDQTADREDGAEICREAQELLALDASSPANSRFDSPLAGSGPPSAMESSRPPDLGPWQLRRRIGRGGMADVWLAARADGLYRRTVAIKRLHPGLASAEVVARFERERQILANLSHPSIAKMLEAGVDSEGVPYIVMELVEGQRIDRYADERHLSVRERVRLVAQVADAAMAAHHMHVVHRDIKPSNVLVDAEGRATLLDFGVAKVLGPAGDTDSLVTRDINRFLTPNYASPEQLEGAALHPMSDVYSLGVLMYELLTGAPPLSLAGRSAVDAHRIATTTEPPRMTQAIAIAPHHAGDREQIAKRRGTTASKLSRELDDDELEAVLSAALRKEPARRPPNAGALRDELHRWLGGEPVLSRRDSWARSALRVMGRNKTVFGLAAALFGALVLGLLLVSKEANRARRANEELDRESKLARERLVDLREATRVLMTDAITSISGIPGTERTVERMMRAGVAIAKRQGDPALQAIIGRTLVSLATNEARELGPTEESLEEMRRGIELVADVAPDLGPDSVPYLPHVRLSYAGFLSDCGYLDEADAQHARAAEETEWLSGRTPEMMCDKIGARTRVAVSLARGLVTRGQYEAAESAIVATLEAIEEARTQYPALRVDFEGTPTGPSGAHDNGANSIRYTINRGAMLDFEGRLLWLRTKIQPESRALDALQSARVSSALSASHGTNLIISANAAHSSLDSALALFESGDPKAAKELLASARPWVESLPQQEHLSFAQLRAVAHMCALEGEIAHSEGRDLAPYADRMRELNRELQSRDSKAYAARTLLASLRRRLAQLEAHAGNGLQAASAFSASLESYDALVREVPGHFELGVSRLRAALGLAKVLQGSADGRAALDHAEKCLASLPGDSRARATVNWIEEELHALRNP